jgi:hypothetical protein
MIVSRMLPRGWAVTAIAEEIRLITTYSGLQYLETLIVGSPHYRQIKHRARLSRTVNTDFIGCKKIKHVERPTPAECANCVLYFNMNLVYILPLPAVGKGLLMVVLGQLSCSRKNLILQIQDNLMRVSPFNH